MTDNTHNGWTSYSTWRVNLELADEMISRMADDGESFPDAYTLGERLREECEEVIGAFGERESGLAYDYAMAFLADVNWREIAGYAVELLPRDDHEPALE